MWHDRVNDGVHLNFKKELDVESFSKGDWHSDFISICETHSLISCPIRNYDNQHGTLLRITNHIVDLPTWQALLLSCAALGSKVVEISIFQCNLTAEHINDLCAALPKLHSLKVVKLDYLYIDTPLKHHLIEALALIFNQPCSLEYISLRGNKLGDHFVHKSIEELHKNYSLNAINLSENELTDVSAGHMLHLMRVHPSLRDLSLAKNRCTNAILDQVGHMVAGTEATHDDEVYFKAINKHFADKNKAIKDANKKRKKEKQPELPEVTPPEEKTIKVGKTTIVVNKTISCIDLSRNEITDDAILALSDSLQGKSLRTSPDFSTIDLVIKGTTALVPANVPHVEGLSFHLL